MEPKRYATIDLEDWNDQDTGLTTNSLNEIVEDAKRECSERDEPIVIVEIVRIVRPATPIVTAPQWDSEKRPAAPVPFPVGSKAFALWRKDNWRSVEVLKIGETNSESRFVKFHYSDYKTWLHVTDLRTEVPAAKPEFKFGDMVRVGKCEANSRRDFYAGQIGIYLGPSITGVNHNVAVKTADGGWDVFVDVHPL